MDTDVSDSIPGSDGAPSLLETSIASQKSGMLEIDYILILRPRCILL